jgi:hypothetical protein
VGGFQAAGRQAGWRGFTARKLSRWITA